MNDKFILDGHKAVPCDDLLEWARWFEKANRIVAFDRIGKTRISTVFLGLDHAFRLPGDKKKDEPLLFETMIFGGEHNNYQTRCSTWEQAEKMHEHAVALVKAANALSFDNKTEKHNDRKTKKHRNDRKSNDHEIR